MQFLLPLVVLKPTESYLFLATSSVVSIILNGLLLNLSSINMHSNHLAVFQCQEGITVFGYIFNLYQLKGQTLKMLDCILAAV